MACEFDFEQKYGDLGKEFIEAHHKNSNKPTALRWNCKIITKR